MRLFIYGMESSGASTFCLFLGQRPGSVAVVDLWSHCLAPSLQTNAEIVLKATVTTTHRCEDHIRSFKPDRTILFLRDPAAVYRSLTKYEYGNYEGSVEDKLARLDEEYNPDLFDLVIRYEDFVRQEPSIISNMEAIGWPCAHSYYDLPRSIDDIRQTNFNESPWLQEEFDKSWAFGNFKGSQISANFALAEPSLEMAEKARRLSPRLSALYR